jgi:hypothetical protein
VNGLSLFQWNPSESARILKMDIIQLFLDYILGIICNHNIDPYSYIINRISFLIQKLGSKIETALVTIGEQGTEKNKFFTDIISKLFGRYVISNENNIRNIISRFNSSIENKILIAFNELQSIDNAKHLNTDCHELLLTDRLCIVDSKYVNISGKKDVSNFIFVRNNHLCTRIENGDRKYRILKFSDKTKRNISYFADLNNPLNDTVFYQ